METKKIYPILIFIFFIFGLMVSGIIGYSLGLKKVKFVTEIPKILPKEIFMRAGEVIKIEGKTVHLKAKVLGGNVDLGTGQNETEILKVNTDQYTKINFPEDPRSGKSSEANFGDIKIGSLLYVFSSENIKNKKSFLTKEITILK